MAAVTTPPAAPRFGRLLRSMPDARLVGRVRSGDEQAFEALFDRYHRPLLAFCRHMLGTREEAEDALQHVFVSAHRSLVSGADRVVELRPWLYAIARNRCVSVLRARREAVALDDVAEPSAAGLAVAQEVEQREDLRDILGDMARLPDDQRAALVLSELGALSHDEVAEVLGVRRDKVKALVFQARESLAGWREARDADCSVIREQLATLTGGALRRAPLRRHLDTCDGCRGFRTEVRRQREAMALLLPVVPSIALKAKVLGAVAATTHGLPAAGIGAGAAGAGVATVTAESGGAIAALGGGIAGKVLVVAAVAGTAGGGYAVVRHESRTPAPAPAVRVVTPPAAGKAPARATPTKAPSQHATPGARPAAAGAHGKTPGSQAAQHRRNPGAATGKQPGNGNGNGNGNANGNANGHAKPAGTAAHPAKPVHPAKPAHPVKPAHPAAGAKPAHPVKPAKPAKAVPPGQADKIVKPAKSKVEHAAGDAITGVTDQKAVHGKG